MPTSYTSLLGLALPVTGELSGTWGDTVNDYITQYLDASVAGTQTISGSQTAVTLSKTTATSLSQAGSGATGSSQYNIINCTGNPASMLTVTVPAASKTYVVVNATSTNQDVKIVGAGPTTGVTLVAGEKAVIAWNGSDFIKVATSTADGVTTLSFGSTGLTPSTATSGAVTVAGTLVAANGGTGQSTYTTGDLLYATGSTALSKLGIGTNGQILTSTGTAPQWSTLSGVAVTTFSAGTTGFTPSSATSGAVTLAGTLATTNGGTGLTSFTANGVVYASSSSALTTGSALTFDGTNLATTGRISTGATLAGLFNTATGAYLQWNYNGTANGYIGTANQVISGGATTDFGISSAGVSSNLVFGVNTTEGMRLTSTGLGIGTSSPAAKLDVQGSATDFVAFNGLNTNNNASVATSSAIKFGFTSTVGTHYATLKISEDAGNDNSGGLTISLPFGGVESTKLTLTSSGNLGLGVTPSAWSSSFKALNIGVNGQSVSADGGQIIIGSNYVQESGGAKYVVSAAAGSYAIARNSHYWYIAPSGTAGNAISFTQAMTLDASGNLGVGATSPLARLDVVSAGANRSRIRSSDANEAVLLLQNSNTGTNTGDGFYLGIVAAMDAYLWNYENNPIIFGTNNTERARITAAGFTQPVAYADTVSALGNTGTATTINLQTANVFTATLTGNCTFTLSNAIATGSSSFTLILTNDGTAGRTVAWAGGSFVFPGGAAALSRTTTANAVDVWVFFTPNGGTTWYGNIAMKDMKA